MATTTQLQQHRHQRPPRFASADPLSDASSEGDDDGIGGPVPASGRHNVVYRALRPDEVVEVPTADGSEPTYDLAHDGRIRILNNAMPKLPGAHVQAGSKAKIKSTWISTTRSHRAAASWAVIDAEENNRDSAFIAKILLPAPSEVFTVEVENPTSTAESMPRGFRGTVRFPSVIDVPHALDTDMRAPVAAGGTHGSLPCLIGLGDSRRRAAHSSREVLLGARKAGDVVVPRSRVLGLARVSRAPTRSAAEDPTAALPRGVTVTTCRHKASTAATRVVVDWTKWARLNPIDVGDVAALESAFALLQVDPPPVPASATEGPDGAAKTAPTEASAATAPT